jgi:hypothetical protein
MKNTTLNPTIPLNLLSRESLLTVNAEIITQLQDRLKAKRFRPQEGDAIKLAYIRVFIQALQVQNSILKDNELDEINKRIELLESAQKQPGGAPVYTPIFEGV